MVSYLNAHDALEQRRRAAKEAGTSGRAGPRTIVSAMACLCTSAWSPASILCWMVAMSEGFCVVCMALQIGMFLIEVTSSQPKFCRADLVTGKQARLCHARSSWTLSTATLCLSGMELWILSVATC